MPESAPLAAALAAQPEPADALLHRHLPEVRLYLAARCRDADLAEELTQEVAARVLGSPVPLDAARNVAGYLVRVAQNVWRDWLRRELVRRRAGPALVREASAAPPADEEMLARELAAGLRRAIDALPRAQRDVVELRHREDLTFQQIADRLGRPLGTVLTQMRSALRKMHDVMEAYR